MAYLSVQVDASEFDDDDLIEELESRGYQCSKSGCVVEADALNFDHVHHLAVCGQMHAARHECLTIVGEAIYQRLM